MTASYKFASNVIVAPGTTDSWNREILKRIDYSAYERDTLAALDAIWQGSWTGTSIIQAIAEKPGVKVIITPYPINECNAASDPRPTWARAGEINVLFYPDAWKPGGKCANGPAATPDAVLLHELVHAYRQVKGHTMDVTLNVPGFEYENIEEFYAILLTNIHLSAKGQKALRKDHKDHARLPLELSTSEPFLTQIRPHRRLVHDFLCDHYGICEHHIRKDQCAFNPIDYFLKHSAQIVGLDQPRPQPPSQADLDAQQLLQDLIERQHLPAKTRVK